jgi:hypothetical protein
VKTGGEMQKNKELLESLRDGFEQLELFDSATLNSLKGRGQMYIKLRALQEAFLPARRRDAQQPLVPSRTWVG